MRNECSFQENLFYLRLGNSSVAVEKDIYQILPKSEIGWQRLASSSLKASFETSPAAGGDFGPRRRSFPLDSVARNEREKSIADGLRKGAE